LQGAANDLFVHDGTGLYLKNLRLEPKTFRLQAATWPYTPWTKEPWEQDFKHSPFVSVTGFLDNSLFDRSSYLLNQRHSARMLVFNDDLLVGVRWGKHDATLGRLLHADGFFEIGRNQYTVFARKRWPAEKQNGASGAAPAADQWSQTVEIRIGAMALAGDTLFAAGTPLSRDVTPDPEFALRALRGEEGGSLIRLNMADGVAAKVCELPSPPVWNGIAISKQRLFIALRDGKVMNFGRRTAPRPAP
jgi:hypothetical protein